MTRQRKKQLENRARGLCVTCGKPSPESTRKGAPNGKRVHCLECAQKVLERQRKRLGNVRKNLNAAIYQTP